MTFKKYIIFLSCFILKQALVAQVVPPPATQAEVDAGLNTFKYLTPYTFANSVLLGSGGTLTGSVWFPGPFTVSGTNWYLNAGISNLAINAAFTNASMIFSNVLTLNPTSTTPRLNGMHLTNQAALARVGDTIDVQPGTYHVPTNAFSMLRNGVNWNFRPGAILISGTTGDSSDYNIPFHDWSGAITSYIWGAGTFIVSNNLANFLNLTNSASRVIWHAKEIRAANQQAAIMQGHPSDVVGGGSKLWVYASDGIYADGYDAIINQHNPNSAQTFIYTSRLVGDTTAGDSAFETSVAYANPGDCIIRAGYARGDFTLSDNMDAELGTLDLGANNVLYSPLAQQGNGVLRNTYVYGTSNRTTSLISTPSDSGLFATHGTFIQCTFVGSTNRPAALITNDNGRATTFIASRFWDGFGATNSIRSKNSQKVVLIGTDTPLGLHANISASTYTNHSANRFKAVATFEQGIDVTGDLNANGQLNASDFTTTGTSIIGGPLEIPTGAVNGHVLTSDGTGVATWAAPSGTGSSNMVTAEIGRLNVTNGISMTGSSVAIAALASFQGDSFALTRATNSSATTGTTNDFQISQSAKPADGLRLLSTSAGQNVWTNGLITLEVTDTNQASVNVDFAQPYEVYLIRTSRTNFDVAFSNTYAARIGRSITVEFPTNLVTTSVQVTNKDAQTVRWNLGVTTNGAPSIVKTNIRHMTLMFSTPTTNHPVVDMGNY